MITPKTIRSQLAGLVKLDMGRVRRRTLDDLAYKPFLVQYLGFRKLSY